MKLVFIAGPWGSGTTALAGALIRLGVTSIGPHLTLNDPKTPNSFESVAFVNLVKTFVDETTQTPNPERLEGLVPALIAFRQDLEKQKFGAWPDGKARIILKYPGASLILPYIAHVFPGHLDRHDDPFAGRYRSHEESAGLV